MRVIFVYVSIWAVLYFMGAFQLLSLDNIRLHKDQLINFVNDNFIKSIFAFLLTYITVVGLSIPGATVLTLTAGFIFSQPLATMLSVIGATSGAMVVFHLSRTVFGDSVKDRISKFPDKWNIKEKLQKNQLLYLFVLRLVPVFPFWFVTALPAVVGVPFSSFAFSTFVGIIPGSYVYTEAGKLLFSILDTTPDKVINSSLILDLVFAGNLGPAFGFLVLWITVVITLNYFFSVK
eukprot:TRINITY_DN7896_c0_g1_i1.p1 TRINITY_DN7896_c0_g1~~TRINITY_DN7896_c0_g1_i1.p1  ORF type:complete len:234 (-),score=-4.07 TRINITY_DN7896_c0_g1_i1:89-790(-)